MVRLHLHRMAPDRAFGFACKSLILISWLPGGVRAGNQVFSVLGNYWTVTIYRLENFNEKSLIHTGCFEHSAAYEAFQSGVPKRIACAILRKKNPERGEGISLEFRAPFSPRHRPAQRGFRDPCAVDPLGWGGPPELRRGSTRRAPVQRLRILQRNDAIFPRLRG